jgi:hypothetical protein
MQITAISIILMDVHTASAGKASQPPQASASVGLHGPTCRLSTSAVLTSPTGATSHNDHSLEVQHV